jgi:hypothetical protein
MRILEIAGDQRSESLLSSSIPQLQSILLRSVSYILGKEIDSYRWLDEQRGTFAVSSNRSWMYFSMMLDLPTDCPPKNTTLILVFPVTVLLIEWFINSNIRTHILIHHQKQNTSNFDNKCLPFHNLEKYRITASTQLHSTLGPVEIRSRPKVIRYRKFAVIFPNGVAFF